MKLDTVDHGGLRLARLRDGNVTPNQGRKTVTTITARHRLAHLFRRVETYEFVVHDGVGHPVCGLTLCSACGSVLRFRQVRLCVPTPGKELPVAISRASSQRRMARRALYDQIAGGA